MDDKKPTQRKFAVMGQNLFKIVNKLVNNQNVCRLLKYQDAHPFAVDEKHPPILDGTELLNKQIIIVPKFSEMVEYEYSFIVVVFDQYVLNTLNPDFKISTVRFDIACPYTEWIIDDENLRPYLLMQEIDTMFNQQKMSGLGNMQFIRCEPLVLSPQLGGYSMRYCINEFN